MRFETFTKLSSNRLLFFMIDPKIAPALQQHAEELKKSQLEDVLNFKLEHRPPASELIDHNILHGSPSTPFSPPRSIHPCTLFIMSYF